MRTRLVAAAAIVVALTGASIGLWRALANHELAADQIDCNIQAPLPPCAAPGRPRVAGAAPAMKILSGAARHWLCASCNLTNRTGHVVHR